MGVTYINPYRFAAFSPLDLSPQAWYDASDTSTITQSGGAVSQWNDKSGNGRNVTQSTAAAQPGTGAITQNGLNVLTFDGGDRLVAATASVWAFMHDGTDCIYALVWQPGTTSDPNALYVPFGTNTSSSNSVGHSLWYDDRAAVPRNNALNDSVTRGVTGTYVVDNVGTNAITANTFSVTTISSNPDAATASARSSIYVNLGSAIANNTYTGAVASGSNPAAPLTIGSFGGGTFPLVGRIAEFIIVSGANATEANRVALRDYLNTKWAVY